MKTLRYVPQDENQTVTLAIRETDSTIVVPPSGYETACAHEQRALDGHETVKRATSAPKRQKGDQS